MNHHLPVETQNQIDQLNQEAWLLGSTDLNRTLALATQAHELSTSSSHQPYKKGVAQSLCVRGRAYSYSGEYDQALTNSFEALRLFQEIGEEEWLSYPYIAIGSAYFFLGEYSEALSYFLKRLTLCEAQNTPLGIAQSLMAVGSVYGSLNDYQQALFYYEKCLPIFQELQEAYWQGLTMANMSEVYLEQGFVEQAVAYANQVLAISRPVKALARVEGFALQILGLAHYKQGQFNEAVASLQEALHLAPLIHHPTLMADCLVTLGRLFFQENRGEEALTYLHQAVTDTEAIQYRKQAYEAHLLLAQIYEQQGELPTALHHYRTYHTIREQVFNDESTRKFKNLEVLHRTQYAQKEAELYASLYEQEQKQRELAETLQQVSVALSSTLNFNELLRQILEQLRHLVPFDRGAVLLRKGNWLEIVASFGFPSSDQPKLELEPDKPNVFWRVYDSQETFKIDHMERDYPAWQPVPGIASPQSWLGVPLMYQGEVRGMLSLSRQERKPFTEEEVNTAVALSTPAGIALENAQLYAQIKRFNEHLEYEITNRTTALREAYEQLEKLDRTKSDFIAVTAHELRTPITILKGYGQMLEQDNQLKEQPRLTKLTAGIVAGAGRLHEIVNTMLLMVKIDNHQLKASPKFLHLGKLLKNIAHEFAPDLAQRQLTLTLHENLNQLPYLEGDPELLTLALQHLIINAIKYTPDGRGIEISGRGWTDQPPQPHWPSSGVEIVIQDQGIGIAPELLQLIFTKFYQTGEVAHHSSGKTKFKGGGPGLGLALALGIAHAHQGLLWAESAGYDEENCPGSRFHLVLPLQNIANSE